MFDIKIVIDNFTAKEFSKIYDVPTSELYLFEITLSNKNTEFVIMPEKIFKNFVKYTN